MMFEARVKTVEAIEATVCVEARASLRIVKSFSAAAASCGSSTQFSASYCCLRVLMQNLQTRYVATAMIRTPPITPPATAPTFGPELVDFDVVLTVEGAADEDTQTVFWHSLQVGGTSEQISLEGHVGQAGVASLHSTQRRKRELKGTEP